MIQETGSLPGPEHVETTERSRRRYFFYDKHHQADRLDEAQWHQSLTPDDEFAIFDRADQLALYDEIGNLYGIHRVDHDPITIQVLGSNGEQFAQFPHTENDAWFGQPIKLIATGDETYPERPVPRKVLNTMVARDLLSPSERRRVARGSHI